MGQQNPFLFAFLYPFANLGDIIIKSLQICNKEIETFVEVGDSPKKFKLMNFIHKLSSHHLGFLLFICIFLKLEKINRCFDSNNNTIIIYFLFFLIKFVRGHFSLFLSLFIWWVSIPTIQKSKLERKKWRMGQRKKLTRQLFLPNLNFHDNKKNYFVWILKWYDIS